MSSEKVSRPLASDDAAMRDPTRTSDCAVQAQTQPQATAPPTVATDPAAAAAAADPATGTVGTPPKPHERDKKKNAEEAATSTADEESGVVPEESPQQDATLTGYRLIAVAVGVCFGALMISVDISILGTASLSVLLPIISYLTYPPQVPYTGSEVVIYLTYLGYLPRARFIPIILGSSPILSCPIPHYPMPHVGNGLQLTPHRRIFFSWIGPTVPHGRSA